MGRHWQHSVWSISVVAVVSASGFEAGAAPAGGIESNASSAAPASPELENARLRERANAAYAEGRYEEALSLLERANAAAPYGLHEFNLGAVHDRMGHCERARDHFEAYLRAAEGSGSPAEGEARHALAELYGICGHAERSGDAVPTGAEGAPAVAQASSSAPVAVVPVRVPPAAEDSERPAEPASFKRTLGVGLLGGAAAAGIGAAIAGIRVQRAEEDLLALGHREGSGAASAREVNALQAKGRRNQALSVGLGVASAVLAGAGVTLLVLDVTEEGALEVGGPGLAGLSYRQSF